MFRSKVGRLPLLALSCALACVSAAHATEGATPTATGTAFLKFSDDAALARYLLAHPGVERLHPKLLWAFGDASALRRAAGEEASGAIGSSFTPNRSFRLPAPRPGNAVDGSGAEGATAAEAFELDSRLWGVARMRAESAWRVTQGEGVLVAVVDTGVDLDHPGLVANHEVNTAEKDGAPGVDDDGNGYVDDLDGWDFYSNKASPEDDQGHGSHVSGTIAGNLPSASFYGVAPRARILAVKTHDRTGASREDAVVKGILYAADRGAKVINCSWGGAPEAPDYSQVLFDAIKYAGAKGALLVAAAGNDGANNDRKASYPASYELPNVMAVASTSSSDRISLFSNYGARSVHVAAPGSNVWSAKKGGGYVTESGTSMASPHAAGAAALVYAKLGSEATPERVRSVLMQNVESLPSLRDRVASGFLTLDFFAK